MTLNIFGDGTGGTNGPGIASSPMNENFSEVKYHEIMISPVIASAEYFDGVIAHSSTVFSGMVTDGHIWITSDAGVTAGNYTEKLTTLTSDSLLIGAKNTAAAGFAVEVGASTTNADTGYTGNSGTTWTDSTNVTMTTAILCADMPSSSLILVGGNDSSNDLKYSTDQAGSWTNPSTPPTGTIHAISMYDNTTGYCVDGSGNIWKTTDGADNWSDTGDNVIGSVDGNIGMYTVSATNVVFFTNSSVYLYVNGSGISSGIRVNSGSVFLGAKETANALYMLLGHSDGFILLKSEDSGATWIQHPIAWRLSDGTLTGSNYYHLKHCLDAYDNDNIVVCAFAAMFKIRNYVP